MNSLLAIYRSQFKTELAVQTQYRAYLAIWILSLITEPIVYMTVWTTITRQQGSVGGYSGGDFAAYYITWMLVRHFAVTLSPDAMEWRIRQGEFSPLLLRPVHPIHIDIAGNIGYKLVALPIILLMMLGLATIYSPTFTFQWWSPLLFIPAMVMAFLIRFISHWILGLAALWFTRAKAIFEIFFVAEIFLTGRLAPLSLLPYAVEVAATILPFRWMISFPVELLLGKMTIESALIGLSAQLIWVFLMIGLLRVVWRAGIKRYSAVGA